VKATSPKYGRTVLGMYGRSVKTACALCERKSDTTSTTRPNACERRAPVGETSPLDDTMADGGTKTGRPSAGNVKAGVPVKLLSSVPGWLRFSEPSSSIV